MKVLEDTPAVLSLGKLCDEHGYSYEWIIGQKPHLTKNVIRIQCNTENVVPIVVPDLSSSSSGSSSASTSSSSSLLSSTSMTPSRQEIDHPKSSSSSSTSPTRTSSTVSSESVTRLGRGDACGIDPYPEAVSSKHVERQERGDPCQSVIPEWLQEFRENLVDDSVPEHRDSNASSSHEPIFSLREVPIWVNTVFTLTSRKTEIARSVRGPMLEGPRAEDALAELYLVLKILVI